MADEDELAAFRERQRQQREEHQEKVRQATKPQGPSEAEAEQAWQKMKSQTDVTKEMPNATEEQNSQWARQENDPKHVHGNSWTAHEQNAAHARDTDLSQQSFAPMSETAKDEVLGEIKKSMDDLKESLKQSETQRHKHNL